MIAWNTTQLIILLVGCLILAVSALGAHQLNARKAVTYVLAWGAIFLAAAVIFNAAG